MNCNLESAVHRLACLHAMRPIQQAHLGGSGAGQSRAAGCSGSCPFTLCHQHTLVLEHKPRPPGWKLSRPKPYSTLLSALGFISSRLRHAAAVMACSSCKDGRVG